MMLAPTTNERQIDLSLSSIDGGTASFWKTVDRRAALVRVKILEELQDHPDQLDRELPNIRSSMQWLQKQSDAEHARLFLVYLRMLFSYLQVRSRDVELENWCAVGLRASERLDRNAADIHLWRGESQYALGQWQQAQASWQAAEAASRDHDPAIYAKAVFALGRLQANQGKYKIALRSLAQAERLFLALGNREAVLSVRSEIAAYYLNRRELDKALKLYLEIDRDYRGIHQEESSNHNLLMLGVVYRHKRVYDQAIRYLSELFERGEQKHSLSAIATATHHLAWTYLQIGEIDKAHTLCGQALSLYEDIQDSRGLSDGYEQLGAICIKQGKTKEAIVWLEKAAAMRRALGNDPGLASCLRREVFAYFLDKNYKQVFILLIKTLSLYMRLRMLSWQRVTELISDFIMSLRKRNA